ncbi:30S ribosomal protein S21 [Psychroflexus planctonicus]|uniref:Small ribosomal subunit protein bS21 n=1 Tax=Psychroflexus planctonicus TaxID=1526575 RepID=A0ABQ1SJ48_9FLAO|nr:30S ribosomal protein S21 [Psychroflexus planctonicus]GGE39245.1 30S ribosomal protein S21 [Psychroflexus planctonicus]
MLIIKVKDGEKIDRALKRLKRKFRDTKVLQTLRDKKEFTKPSVLNRQQLKKAQYIQSIREKENL